MLIRAFNACVRLPIFSWYFSVEREQGSSLFVSATTSIIKKHQFVIMEAEKIKAIETVGAIFSFNRAGWSLRMVAFGDRKDFLQFLRMVHFRRKCTMRKNCKRNAAEALPLPARDYCPHGLNGPAFGCLLIDNLSLCFYACIGNFFLAHYEGALHPWPRHQQSIYLPHNPRIARVPRFPGSCSLWRMCSGLPAMSFRSLSCLKPL